MSLGNFSLIKKIQELEYKKPFQDGSIDENNNVKRMSTSIDSILWTK